MTADRFLGAGVALHDAEVATSRPVSLFGIHSVVRLTALRTYPYNILPVVASAVQRLGMKRAGPPVCILRPGEGGCFNVLAAYPTREPPRIGPPFTTSRLPGGLVVQALHRGPWSTVLNTYDRLSEWLAVHHVREVPVMWEEYLIGPDEIDDSTVWQTRIVVPLSGVASRLAGPRENALSHR